MLTAPATAAAVRRTPGAAGITVELIEDVQRFTSMRTEWTELLHSSAASNPFLTWEWLHSWWTHLRGMSHLHVLAVREGGLLVAIAPLRMSHRGLPWLSRLEFLGTGSAGSDYLDLIVRHGHEAESLDAVGRCLRSRSVPVRLRHLAAESAIARLSAPLTRQDWTASVSADGECPVVRLSGHSWDSYLATLGPSHRANVRRRLRAISQHFEMRFDRVASEDERHTALECLMAFHVQRWREHGGSSAFRTTDVRAFQDDATSRALHSGWLRMYVLRLNGLPVAIMYGFAHGGRFYFYQHGFDAGYQQHSVGLVLMSLTIRAALDEGLREFDMLWGVEPYKFLWTSERRPLHRIDLFPSGVAGRIHQGADAARRRLAMLARHVRPRRIACGT